MKRQHAVLHSNINLQSTWYYECIAQPNKFSSRFDYKNINKPEPTQSHYLRITNINGQMDKIRDKATYTTTQTLNGKLKVSSMLINHLPSHCFLANLSKQMSRLDAYQLLEFFSRPQSMTNINNHCRQNLGYNLVINWRKNDIGNLVINMKVHSLMPLQ